MNTVSADSRKSWSVSLDDRVAALEIALLKRTYVLPWNQFVYAEGGDDEVRAVFATHEVIIRGSGLDELLNGIAAQQVEVMYEPSRTDRFSSTGPRFIREIVVQKNEAGQG
jgi:hypothetical protein